MQFHEPELPKRLKDTQEWFAGIITQPLDSNGKIAKRTPDNKQITKEADHFISPSPSLHAFERIEIYNQQYWWRLLNTLQEAYPFLLRLFGSNDFNKSIGVPYLKKYPSNDWTLNSLGNRLPKWIKESYHADDQELVWHAAAIDNAFNSAFFIKQMPPIALQETTLETKLHLQPHVQLFTLPYDLFSFRKEMLMQNPDYWVEHDFPELKNDRDYHFMLFRKPNNQVSWRETKPFENAILQKLSSGESIDEICTWIDTQPHAFQKEAEDKLSLYFKTWSSECLITNKKS